ncbi:hypothetical protein Tco_0807528 [Tanacetum coccineum]
MVEDNVGNQFRLNVGQIAGNQNGYHAVQNVGNQELHNKANEKGCCLSSVPAADCSKGKCRIQLKLEEFDLMAVVGAYEEIEEVNTNCTLMENLQQSSTSGTQADSAPVYDSDGSVEEQDTDLLESTTKPHMVQQNDSNVIPVDSSMDPSRGTVE